MNGARREISTGELGANGEDLNVVLGRFQDWAATRGKTPPQATKGKTRQGPPAAMGKLPSDTREISYDQALRASRYRRRDDSASFEPVPATPKSAGERGVADSEFTRSDLAGATRQWYEGEDVDREPWGRRWPEVTFPRMVHSVVAQEFDRVPTQPRAETTQAKQASRSPASPVSVPARPPDPSAIKASRAKSPARNASRAKIDSSPAARPASGTKAEQVRESTLARRRPQPEFREVLKGTAALAASGANSLPSGKSVCLTLRVSDGEQARILACAAQANLSLSAYLRQCALGVDELRGQVEVALSKLRKEQERTVPPPGISAIPGILRRFGMQCLQRFRRSGNEHAALSIR